MNDGQQEKVAGTLSKSKNKNYFKRRNMLWIQKI